MAGETRLEHATYGFGDRCSTIELLPYGNSFKMLFKYTIGLQKLSIVKIANIKINIGLKLVFLFGEHL